MQPFKDFLHPLLKGNFPLKKQQQQQYIFALGVFRTAINIFIVIVNILMPAI